MILYCTPYRTDKNLGKSYNEIMRMIAAEDAACFTDGDSMFLTADFGHIIDWYHNEYPEAVLTCKTNRIHPLSKQLNGNLDEVADVREAIIKAESQKKIQAVTEILPGETFSGVLMLVPKKVWMEIPFIENGKCLGVDSAFRQDLHKAGKKVYVMEGVYVFHQYRLLHGINYKNHLL